MPGKAAKARRVGGQSQELLLQQGFLRFVDSLGREQTRAILRDPLPLSHGKGSWPIFACFKQFFPSPRDLGHRGVLVEHFAFDRALFSSLRRLILQDRSMRQASRAATLPSAEAVLGPLLQWQVFTGCSCHDVHNALKWVLAPFFKQEQVLKDTWAVIAI